MAGRTFEEYDKYFVRKPKLIKLPHHATGNVSGFTYPYQVYMDSELVKESPVFIDVGWRYAIPTPNPITESHSHPFDEVLFYTGSDHSKPHELGGEIAIQMDDAEHIINTTSAIYIPRNVVHSIRYINLEKPILNVGVSLKGEYV